jgi:hypothetical protein
VTLRSLRWSPLDNPYPPFWTAIKILALINSRDHIG